MFIKTEPYTLELEHSLVSLSKWESEFQKPFLAPGEKTTEEAFGYIRAMNMTPNIPEDVFLRLYGTPEIVLKINDYIESKETATTFREFPNKVGSREIVTAEIIYYWMISLQIPVDRENWHLNRLITLIKVLNEKNAPQKKMSRAELAAHNRELVAKRRQQLGTNG